MANAFFKIDFPGNEPVKGYAPGSDEKKSLKKTLGDLKGHVEDIPLYIGGEEVRTGKTAPVVAPHDHKRVVAQSHQASEEHVEAAIQSCLSARKEWAELPWQDRAAVFLKAADLLSTTYRDRLNASTMLGQSKTVHQAEIDAACELVDFFKFNAYYLEKIFNEQPASQQGVWNRLEARGLEGLVYAVTPFNFSSIAINLACAPALMGCSVLWKPSATAMWSAWEGVKLLEAAGLPKGVINVVDGDAPMISSKVIPHPDLGGLHFTGSTATFNHLWQQIGQNINNYKSYPRIVGETGGKDFVFAHKSAVVEELVVALVRGAFEYQGQKCSAASRAYIPKSIWPQVKEQVVAMTNQLKMGDVEDFTNFVGAVIDERAFDRITGYIKEAESASGASIIAGGEYDKSKGYFIRPTIIEATDPNFRSMKEEIFGPVLTIHPYDDDAIDEALTHCDESTSYALTGAIFAKDRQVISQLSHRLSRAAGNFYINDKPTGAVVGQQPFGGARASGTNDKAGSVYNLLRWVSHRTMKENFMPITDYRYPFMQES